MACRKWYTIAVLLPTFGCTRTSHCEVCHNRSGQGYHMEKLIRNNHGFPERNLHRKVHDLPEEIFMTRLAIDGPPELLDYGTFLFRDQLCYQRVWVHTGHTSRSPAYADKADAHLDLESLQWLWKTILWIKIVPRGILKLLNSFKESIQEESWGKGTLLLYDYMIY